PPADRPPTIGQHPTGAQAAMLAVRGDAQPTGDPPPHTRQVPRLPAPQPSVRVNRRVQLADPLTQNLGAERPRLLTTGRHRPPSSPSDRIDLDPPTKVRVRPRSRLRVGRFGVLRGRPPHQPEPAATLTAAEGPKSGV